MESQSIVDTLPEEILELIVIQSQGALPVKAFNDLRLLSKSFSRLVEPYAFGSVKIESRRASMCYMDEKLKYMASGSSLWTRWCKRLEIGSLCLPPDAIALNREWEDTRVYTSLAFIEAEEGGRPSPRDVQRQKIYNFLTKAWEVQCSWLIPAIMALTRLEEASLYRHKSPDEAHYPTNDILRALGGLPQLRKVVLGNISIDKLELDPIKSLDCLELWQTSTKTLQGIKTLVVNSPRLTTLDIALQKTRPGLEPTTTDLSTLVGGVIKSPGFSPALRGLYLRTGGLRLTQSCIPYLLNLTALLIGDCGVEPGATPLFWEGMRESAVHLRSLDVYELDLDCAQYIASYSGLKTLRIHHWEAMSSGSEYVERGYLLYGSVIPAHSATLEELSVITDWTSGGSDRLGPWCVTKGNLEVLLRCKQLKNLNIAVPFDVEESDVVGHPLDVLLSSLCDELPRLQELQMSPLWPERPLDHHDLTRQWLDREARDAFVLALEKAEFTAQKRPQFLLEAAKRDFALKTGRSPGWWRYERLRSPWSLS